MNSPFVVIGENDVNMHEQNIANEKMEDKVKIDKVTKNGKEEEESDLDSSFVERTEDFVLISEDELSLYSPKSKTPDKSKLYTNGRNVEHNGEEVHGGIINGEIVDGKGDDSEYDHQMNESKVTFIDHHEWYIDVEPRKVISVNNMKKNSFHNANDDFDETGVECRESLESDGIASVHDYPMIMEDYPILETIPVDCLDNDYNTIDQNGPAIKQNNNHKESCTDLENTPQMKKAVDNVMKDDENDQNKDAIEQNVNCVEYHTNDKNFPPRSEINLDVLNKNVDKMKDDESDQNLIEQKIDYKESPTYAENFEQLNRDVPDKIVEKNEFQITESRKSMIVKKEPYEETTSEIIQSQNDDIPQDMIKVKNIDVKRTFVLPENVIDTLQNAVLMNEEGVEDIYYDTPSFDLLSKDCWLRKRGGQWQIRVSIERKLTDGAPSKYREFHHENDVKDEICGIFNRINVDTSLKWLLNSLKIEEFTRLHTMTKTYVVDGCKINLDLLDFGLKVAEIGIMVSETLLIPDALCEIEQVADKLGFQAFGLAKLPLVDY